MSIVLCYGRETIVVDYSPEFVVDIDIDICFRRAFFALKFRLNIL